MMYNKSSETTSGKNATGGSKVEKKKKKRGWKKQRTKCCELVKACSFRWEMATEACQEQSTYIAWLEHGGTRRTLGIAQRHPFKYPKLNTDTEKLTEVAKKLKTAQYSLPHIMEPDFFIYLFFFIPRPTSYGSASLRWIWSEKPEPWTNIAQVWCASTTDHMDLGATGCFEVNYKQISSSVHSWKQSPPGMAWRSLPRCNSDQLWSFEKEGFLVHFPLSAAQYRPTHAGFSSLSKSR